MSKKRLDLQMFADASAQLQNTTGAAGMTAEMKTYYEKTLLDLAEPALVHDQFGDSYPIPANNGKTIYGTGQMVLRSVAFTLAAATGGRVSAAQPRK